MCGSLPCRSKFFTTGVYTTNGGIEDVMVRKIDSDLFDWNDIKTKYNRSSILIGNGFSQNIWRGFKYKSLFEKVRHDPMGRFTAQDLAVFNGLRTRNFEAVLSALTTSKAVAKSLGESCANIEERQHNIRNALILAVRNAHIPWKFLYPEILERIGNELLRYPSIFTTNYDLLIYWSIMCQPDGFRDYFWNEEFNIANTEIWKKEKSKVHFLHGGLHLYRQPNGQTLKRHATSVNLLELFAKDYRGAIPLFVSEGTTQQKHSSIYRSNYLTFVYSLFLDNKDPLVVFGHGLGDSDKHIVSALAKHDKRALAVSIHDSEDIKQQKERILRLLASENPRFHDHTKVHFFNSKTHPLGSVDLQITI